MLKTWYDLVQEAREAGVSVAQKGVQLWNVGAGLPLDAIKNGSITSWGCSYEISDQEVVSLVDALGKNDSLERLDLSLAGLEWMPPVKREERSALSTLLQVMNEDSGALEALEKFVISKKTRWEIPVAALRAGPEKGQKALAEAPFLAQGGPQREELHAMFELLCKNRNPEPGESELELSFNAVSKSVRGVAARRRTAKGRGQGQAHRVAGVGRTAHDQGHDAPRALPGGRERGGACATSASARRSCSTWPSRPRSSRRASSRPRSSRRPASRPRSSRGSGTRPRTCGRPRSRRPR